MPEAKPYLVSAATVSKTLRDARFYTQVPEFSSLRSKIKTMRVSTEKKGCSGCNARRIEQNMFKDYTTILLSLGPDALARFKKYLGVTRLMMNVQDPTTSGIKLKML